ncbi:cadherin-like beta sandwich domain-containing protein [Candidatus Poriferisodalis sp.]|uniref:cadherin-like beta sandwich domain-containing protein n=1 Tax=Candidatus Poriferisodalis sp. TaxID=3101277 RepID=UPI003B02AF37
MTRTPLLRRAPFLLAAATAMLLTVLPAPPAGAAHQLDTPTVVVTAGDGQVELSWGAVTNANRYRVEHREQFSTDTPTRDVIAAPSTSATITGLTNGQFYVFRVQARDVGNTHTLSDWSDWVTVMPEAMPNKAGSLDATFGGGSGVVTTDIGTVTMDEANAVALRPDGQIVVAGTSDDDFAVAIYYSNGGHVTTFRSTDIGTGTRDAAVAVADSKFITVVAGTSSEPDGSGGFEDGDFAVVRYNRGRLDTNFDTDGKVVTDISGSGSDDTANAMVVQYDSSGNVDKIVVVGTSDDDFVVARYTATGALDTDGTTGFGPASGGSRPGYVVTDIGSSTTDEAHAVDIDGDGNIVVAGYSGDDFAVVRYEADGDLDSTFSTDGKVTTSVTGTNAYGIANAVAVQPDGKIVIAGLASDADGEDYDLAVLRYTTAGAPDTTFSGDGMDAIDFSSGGQTGDLNDAKDVVVQPDGKIVVAGFSDITSTHVALARYNADGTLDAGFGTGGKVTTLHRATTTTATAVALQPDGRIVAAGSNDNDFAVFRYLGEAEPATLVGNAGQATHTTIATISTASGSQGFTTGDNTAGYVLSGIDVEVNAALDATAAAKVKAELWSSAANGRPDAFLEALTVPNTLSVGVNSLTAPAGTVLAPDTSYNVVIYTTANQAIAMRTTGADAEDSGAAAGWSVADIFYFINAADPHSPGAATWTGHGGRLSMKIAVKGSARPEGTGKPIFSATLTPADLDPGFDTFGCEEDVTECSVATVLSNADFAYEDTSFSVTSLRHVNSATDSSRRLNLVVGPDIADAAFKDLTLHLGNKAFAIADGTAVHATTSQTASEHRSTASWSSTDMTWAASDRIRVVLTIPETSSNNDLSALSAETATGRNGTYSGLTLSPSSFAAGTTSYSATVGNDVTHAKLTASVADTGIASMKVGKQGETLASLADGATSDPIALAVGDNALVVEVTAENGRSKTYTVTVRRQSANADLASLVVTTSTSETGTYSGLTLSPGFSAGGTTYSATVGSSVSHAIVTATAAEPGTGDDPVATLKAGKVGSLVSVRSGADSDPVALAVGVNRLAVEVTAENGTVKTYRVTVTRREPSADLSALVVKVATSETGTYSARTLSPGFAAGTTSYSVAAARDVTHAKITATALETGATLQVGKAGSLVSVASGVESGPIALVRGANAIEVRVAVTVAGTTVTETYTVSVNVAAKPSALEGLVVTPTSHGLDATWTPPGVSVDGYDVHYTSMSGADLADDAPAGSYEHPRWGRVVNRNPARGWVTLPKTGIAPKYGIGYLTPGTAYRVRVRAYNSFGTGPWTVGSGTAGQAPYLVSLSASAVEVREGDAVTITATVTHNRRPIAIQQDLEVLLSMHLGTAETGDVGTATRIVIPKYTHSGSVTIPTFRDADGDDETFAVLIRWIPSRDFAKAGHPAIVWVTVTEGDPAPTEPQVLVPELTATGGDGALRLTWHDTADDAVGYDVHYKLSTARDRRATATGNPATGWVDAGHTGTGRSMTVSGLDDGVAYDARVRITWDDGTSTWSKTASAVTDPSTEDTSTNSDTQNDPPEQPTAALPTTVTLSLGRTAVAESVGTVTVTATLDEPAPVDGSGISLRLYPANTSTAAQGADYTMPASIDIAAGQRSGTVVVTVVDDDIDETAETLDLAVFADTGYATLAADTALTITDNDTAAITVNAASPIAVSESATGTYTVVLASEPTADVTVTPTSSDTGAVSVSPASHTFTASTWNTPVTFTVTGVADSDTNDESVTVSHRVTSSDANYTAALAATVRVSVTDTTPPPPQQEQQPVNQAPTVASAIDDATIAHHSGTHTVSLAGVFADPDNDTLTVTAASSHTAVATVTVAADHTSLTVTARSRGTATITVTADDGAGGTVEDTFAVTVKSAPTVASALGDVTLEIGADLEISLSGVFDDPDGDALRFTTDSTDAALANAFAFQETLTLTAFAEGTVTITVIAEDADGNQVSDTFEITVTAPQPAPQSTLTGIAARYDTNGDGAIDGSEYQQVKSDWFTGKITQAQFLEIVRIHLKTR